MSIGYYIVECNFCWSGRNRSDCICHDSNGGFGKRNPVTHDVTDHVECIGGVRGPDADVGRLGDDKGALVADVGRVLGRRDEKVVVRGVLDAHVGHVGVVRACLCGRLNPNLSWRESVGAGDIP